MTWPLICYYMNSVKVICWLFLGGYVVVTPITEGDRVKAEIVHILYKHHIKNMQEEGKW